MAAGAKATISAYRGKNRVAHPKARKTSVTAQSATDRLGGQGPVVRDKVNPFYK